MIEIGDNNCTQIGKILKKLFDNNDYYKNKSEKLAIRKDIFIHGIKISLSVYKDIFPDKDLYPESYIHVLLRFLGFQDRRQIDKSQG